MTRKFAIISTLLLVAAGTAWWLQATFSARAGGGDGVEQFARGWNGMLTSYVKNGTVDYGAWRPRREELGVLLRGIEEVPAASLGERDAALGFWIDAYNARVVYEVLGGQSAASSLGRTRLFFLTRFRVAGQAWSLDSLEKMVRKDYADPRVHFALNCASRSCPMLRSESYRLAARRLGDVLDDQGRRFLADPSRNRFDVPNRIAHVSEIFNWYSDDFTAASPSLQTYMARYAPAEAVSLLAQSGFRVEYLPYDWNLNGTL